MKTLYRNPRGAKIAGVSQGLGEYLDLDPNLIRILFVVSIFFGGGGLLAYLIAWLILPAKEREPMQHATASSEE